jgi:pimeloyl-ACP methyl ester carboxylesterase
MESMAGPSLQWLLEVPLAAEAGPLPMLCFLHGYAEAAPTPIATALTRYGPLEPGSLDVIADRFIIAAPQLPGAGDIWHRYAQEVVDTMAEIQRSRAGDGRRIYLTGFSFGGNGVLDLALAHPDRWTALWPVDPTRVPARDPGPPVWLSIGEAARRSRDGFIRAMKLQEADGDLDADRIWLDQDEDHIGSARRAYRDERIYEWLARHRVESGD